MTATTATPAKSTTLAAGEALADLGARHPEIVVCVADSYQTMSMHLFGARFPERTFDFGIMEQCTVTAAAGLATCGLRPFVASYGVFLTMRALEQLRTFVALPNLPVTFISGHGGLAAAVLGPTHQAVDDLGFARTVPNLRVIVPADATATARAVAATLDLDGPTFIRVNGPAPALYGPDYRFEPGQATLLADHGHDVSIVACGLLVARALAAAETLREEGIGARVLDLATLKPFDVAALAREAALTGALVTAEEHSAINGLGGAVAEALAATHPVPLERVGIADRYGETGPHAHLLEEYGLTSAAIVAAARRAVARKHGR